MDCLFCKQRAVNFYRRKSVKCFHNCFVRYFHCFLNTLPLYHLSSHTGCCNSCSTSECFEFHIADDLVVINVKIDSHDISTFCISNCSYTAGVLNLSYISWMLKMIHYFLCIHNVIPPFCLFFIQKLFCIFLLNHSDLCILLLLFYKIFVER